MITFIEGVLEDRTPTRAVVNAGGVGYEVCIPLSTFDRLPREGERIRLFTHHWVRDDNEALYGFHSPAERVLFERLIGVNGIGPRTAMAALSGLSSRDLIKAVVEHDVRRLSSISGVGKKTAERIITELKDKFSEAEVLEAIAGAGGPGPEDHAARDAISALVALGYKQAEAVKMMDAIPVEERDGLSTEALIRRALSPATGRGA
ncbi:MAG: Holliday junction branch migration protein RuvA [Kiritimatiellae bacterium]|nr:Holliday junction branch migration protein RuvA [Kiritimatiellia bacterium]